MLGQPLAAFVGQAVFLQSTVGLVRDGHFNQTIRQGWFEVALMERFAIKQTESGLQRFAAHFSLDHLKQLADLGVTWGVDAGTVSNIMRNIKAMNGAESV